METQGAFLILRKDIAMKKLFVSQPINGKTDIEILSKRRTAKNTVEKILREKRKL